MDPVLSVSVDGAWLARADVNVRLSPVLIEAVMRGVPLYFVSEFELKKSRWWWVDKKIFTKSKTVRLSYHAVTQQYRVAIGGLHQTAYDNLEQALTAAVSMRGWPVKDPSESLESGDQEIDWNDAGLESRLRVRLDSAQLPKPLQINAITNRDWNLSSDWVTPKLEQFIAGVPSP